MPAYQELCQIIVAYQTEIYRHQSQLSQHEASAQFATDAMRGALPASELGHALRARCRRGHRHRQRGVPPPSKRAPSVTPRALDRTVRHLHASPSPQFREFLGFRRTTAECALRPRRRRRWTRREESDARHNRRNRRRDRGRECGGGGGGGGLAPTVTLNPHAREFYPSGFWAPSPLHRPNHT